MGAQEVCPGQSYLTSKTAMTTSQNHESICAHGTYSVLESLTYLLKDGIMNQIEGIGFSKDHEKT